jgi:hypothetical protein
MRIIPARVRRRRTDADGASPLRDSSGDLKLKNEAGHQLAIQLSRVLRKLLRFGVLRADLIDDDY